MPSEAERQFVGWVLDEVVLPNARIRQGDLIRFEGATDTLRKLAIVVTADCDLEQKKHARTVTLVPVVSATTIIEHYLIPDDCEKKKPLIEQYVFGYFSILHNQEETVKYALLRERLSNRGDPPSIVEIAAAFLLHQTDAISFNDYAILMSEMNLAARKIASFKDQLRSRGDLLILPEAHPLGIKGHIAWVRQLWQTSPSDVALRTSEVAARAGERIARLDSPFRYRLTQLIAQVFSDIGLPNMPDSIDQILDEAYR